MNGLNGTAENNGIAIAESSENGHEDPSANDRDALSSSARNQQKHEDELRQLIIGAKAVGLKTIDLSRRCLKNVPLELLELTTLQYLYLEGNELTSLPDNFFDCLVNLQWLDLRNNYIASIPSTYIGSHQCLRTLLLEDNELKTLPLELGLVNTLNGLNIANNPLEFPPPEIVEKGTQATLGFLRELIIAKSQGRLPTGGPRLEDLRLNDRVDTDSPSSDDNSDFNPAEYAPPRYYGGHGGDATLVHTTDSSNASEADNSELIGPVSLSAGLHKPVSYVEMKQAQYEKFKRAGALGMVDKRPSRQISIDSNMTSIRSSPSLRSPLPFSKTPYSSPRSRIQSPVKPRYSSKKKPLGIYTNKKKSKGSQEVSRYPSPPPANRIEERYLEERRLAELRNLKEKQEFVLQKRRDANYLREWRDDAKSQQQDRYREARIFGGAKDPIDIAEQAPFDISKEHMKVPTNEERIKQGVREKHEQLRRVKSPNSQKLLEQERLARDQELKQRIKQHTHHLAERKTQSKGTPQQQMEAAKRDLQIANQLQSEIEQRRKNLEYRFTAFTGDVK